MNNQIKKSYKIVLINGVKIFYLYRPRLEKGPKVSKKNAPPPKKKKNKIKNKIK